MKIDKSTALIIMYQLNLKITATQAGDSIWAEPDDEEDNNSNVGEPSDSIENAIYSYLVKNKYITKKGEVNGKSPVWLLRLFKQDKCYLTSMEEE